VLTIWEDTCHRQIQDGLEVMERKGAHSMLLEQFPDENMRRRIEAHLALPQA
jgi:acyl-CoA dehydrogenase